MFNKKVEPPTQLEKELTKLYEELENTGVLEASYEAILSKIERLEALKPPAKEKKRISPDTLVSVGGNLLGIISILGYERAHVITSKAVGQIFKPRI